jgi:hypothetical protein
MYMKTKYRFLFVLTLMFSLVTSAWAEESWDSGNTKVTLSYDGVFTVAAVEGTDGKMADYGSAEGQPWANSRGNVRSIVVSDGVTSIGNYAFSNFYGVQSISIGNDVKSIGSYVFSSWWNTINVLTLPASVEFIADHAFVNNNIQQLYVKAVNPPVLESQESIKYFSIFVPEGSVTAYKTAEYWSNRAYNISIDFSDYFVPFTFDISGITTIDGTAWKGMEHQVSVTPVEGITITKRTNMTETGYTPAKDSTHYSFGVTFAQADAANIAFEQQDILANLFFTPTELLDKFTISPSAPDENGKVADVKAGTEVKVTAKDGYKLKLTVSPILTGVTVYENDTITSADLKVGDIIKGNVRINDIAEKGLLFVDSRYADANGVRTGTMRPGGNGLTFNADASFWGYKPINSDGNVGDAWRVERINEDNSNAFAYGAYLVGIKYNKDVTYNEDYTEATFPMPEEDMAVNCKLVRDLATCAEVGIKVDGVFTDSVRLGTDNPERGYYAFGGFQQAAIDKTDPDNPKELTYKDVSYTFKMKQGDEYVNAGWQPGKWRLEVTAIEGSDYIGTAYRDIVMYEGYIIRFSRSDAEKLNITVDGVTTSPVNRLSSCIEPGKTVVIKAKSGYSLSNVEAKYGDKTFEVTYDATTDTYSMTMPRSEVIFFYNLTPKQGNEITILPGEFATYYSASSVSLAEGSAGEMYYISAVSKSEVTLTKAEPQAVPEYTPIVLHNPEDTTITVVLRPDAEGTLADVSIADRDFIYGTTGERTFTADETAADDYYICNGQAFVKVRGAGTLPANRVYLKFAHAVAAAPRLVFGFGGTVPGTTGIDSVENGEQGNESWYDLNGRKLQGKPTQKGLYIKNGKKVVIK